MTELNQIELPSNIVYDFINQDNYKIDEKYFLSLKNTDFTKEIFNSVIVEKLFFDKNIHPTTNIYFENCTIDKLEFDDCTFEQIWFKNCTFINTLKVLNGNFKSFFWFQDCIFNSSLIIRNGNFENLFFNNSKIHEQIRIEGGNFENFSFHPNSETDVLKINGLLTFINDLELISNNGIKIIAEKTFIRKILCKGYLNNNSRIDFNDIRNNLSVEFTNVKNDGKIYLNNFLSFLVYPLLLKDKNVNIIDKSIFKERSNEYLRFVEKAQIETVTQLYNKFETPTFIKEIIIDKYFSEITYFGEEVSDDELFFEINNSSIGYLEFINFDVNQYKNISIESSDLSSIKLINSFVPTKKNRIKSIDKSYLNHYSIYNDLFVSAKNQNNIKDRNKYFQASQMYLLKNLMKNWFKNSPSIISNLISKLFSNYGQSWFKATIVTILLSTLFFGLYLLSFKNLQFDFSQIGWNFFKVNYLKYLPEFINPTHKIDFIDNLKCQIGNWTRCFDFLGRIIVGIGIYETIKSFRKYVN